MALVTRSRIVRSPFLTVPSQVNRKAERMSRPCADNPACANSGRVRGANRTKGLAAHPSMRTTGLLPENWSS